jgi:hypothetical protein
MWGSLHHILAVDFSQHWQNQIFNQYSKFHTVKLKFSLFIGQPSYIFWHHLKTAQSWEVSHTQEPKLKFPSCTWTEVTRPSDLISGQLKLVTQDLLGWVFLGKGTLRSNTYPFKHVLCTPQFPRYLSVWNSTETFHTRLSSLTVLLVSNKTFSSCFWDIIGQLVSYRLLK